MEIRTAGVDSVIIYFEKLICDEVNLQVKETYEKIKKLPSLIEIVPSYTSILITYDIFVYDEQSIISLIYKTLQEKKEFKKSNSKLFLIPVYYGKDVGLDLQRVAKLSNMSISEVIKTHTNFEYKVYAIGFSPGFAYLGSVDKRIHTPRLDSPRKKVPKGAVAIANEQTAIYPNESPGGWNILGITNFKLYDKSLENLTPFSIGDRVKFYEISKEEFLDTKVL